MFGKELLQFRFPGVTGQHHLLPAAVGLQEKDLSMPSVLPGFTPSVHSFGSGSPAIAPLL